jgi:hypothetical protein
MEKHVQEALALTLQPNTYKMYTELCAAKEAARKNMTDDERRDLFARHAGGDKQATSELCGAVVSEVNINVLGQLFAMSFFETKTYGPADFPLIKAELYDKNFFVSSVGINGGNPMMQKAEGILDYPLMFGFWATPAYEFPIYNLQIGPLNYLNKAISRVGYELGLQMDTVAKNLLNANRTASGLASLLNLHSSIVAANIPSANYLDLSAIAGTGKFTVEKMKRILDYAVRFTTDVQPLEGGELAGPMEVRAVHCSSRRLRDMWDQADIVALVSTDVTGEPVSPITTPTQTVDSQTRSEIWRSGRLERFLGKPFTLVPNNRLAADEVYVAMSRPAGQFHSKSSFDATFHNQSPEMATRNMESVWMRKCGVFHQTNSQIPNYLVVKL